MVDVLLDALIDTLKIVPFLYLSYLVLDFIEKKSSVYKLNFLFLKHLGPLFGALLGCIPQCGFSVIAASLYAQNGISAGTLVACFISTSDEALPMFLSNPSEYRQLGLFLICKIVIALIAGYLIDFVIHKQVNEEDDFEIEVDGLCDCSSNSFVNALNKTAKTIFFIFLINLVLGTVIHFIGEDRLSALLAVHPYLQPVIATIVGFIPNCAISILLVQLYMLDALTFGGMIAGLCSGAGVGMAVLFKNNKNMKENWLIVLYIGIVALISGVLIDLFLKGVIG